MKDRSNFTNKLGFVLAASGSAVGLGNIWRFPYLAAQYNDGSECKEQQEPSDRLERTADKVCKISISGRVLHAAADKYGEIFHHPSADNGVVRENDDRNDNGKQS